MKSFIEILLFVAFMVEFGVGFFALVKGKDKQINRYFFALMLSASLWSLFLFFAIILVSDFLVRLSIVFGLFGSIFFFLFSKSFSEIKKKSSNYAKIVIVIPIILAFPILFSNLIIQNTIFYSNGAIELPDGKLAIIFYIYHFLFYFIGLYILYKGYKNSEGIRKIQFQHLFAGIGVLVTLFAIINMILPGLGIYHFITLSPSLFLVLAIFFIYAITRHRLMDIRLAIKKTAAHTIAIAVVLAVYTFLIFIFQKVLVEQYSWNFTVTVIIAVLIIALSVEPLRKLVIKSVNEIFYTKKEKQKEQVFKSSVTLASVTELEQAIEHIVTAYLSFLESEKICFLVRSKKNRSYQCHYPKGCQLDIKADEPLLQYLRLDPRVLVKDEIPYLIDENDQLDRKLLKSVEGRLKKLGISLVIPLGSREEIFALFLLGPKKKDEAYTKEDIDSLQHFQITTSPAILNTIMYKEAVERITAD